MKSDPATTQLSEAVGFDLGASLGYLVGRVSKQMTHDLNARMVELGLTTTQWSVLAALWSEDGLAQSELSARTGIDAATLTTMLRRMQSRGLVDRVRDPADQRVQRVYLTSRDDAVRTSIRDMAGAVNARALHGFTDRDQATLVRLLGRVRINLEAPDTDQKGMS